MKIKQKFTLKCFNGTFIILWMLLLGLGSLHAQNIQISGMVSDFNGNPIPGSSIVVKGTSNGAASDFDGKFNIDASSSATLIVSYIGYHKLEVDVNGRTSIDIVLEEDVAQLDEVVVTGYGTTKKGEITSAITRVDESDFNSGNINSPEELLKGRVAGLNVSRVGGDPNQPFTIRLRGLSTFGANAQPLVVIDGIVGGRLDTVDPRDIESVSVLKDASAGAIYGTRGSSGVIIITTKSGKGTSKPGLEYSGYSSVERISKSIQVASAKEFLAEGGADLGGNTNWLDEVTIDAVSNVHNIAFTNSNQSGLSYRASLNYRDIGAILKGTGFKQTNTRINVSQKLLDDKLNLTGIVSVSNRESNVGFAQALRFALNFIPTAPIFENRSSEQLGRNPESLGGYFETGVQDVFNPVAINALSSRTSKLNTLVGNFKADLEVLKDFNVSANYSLQVENTSGGEFYPSTALFGGVNDNGAASKFSNIDKTNLFELTALYQGNVGEDGKVKYDILGGYSFQEFESEGLSARNTDFITNDVGNDNLGLGQGINEQRASVGSFNTEAKLSAFFGRFNLTYDSFIFTSGSIRREASSRFGPNNRWGTFWALSGGVDLNRIISADKIDQLKLRLGYGVTGNEPADRYAFAQRLGRTGSGYANGEYIAAIGPVSNPNPNLKWEEKAEFNVGVDISAFNSRFSASLDYFIRKTSDLLNRIIVPSPPNLFNTSLVNLGELETKGFEAQMNYGIIAKDKFSWDIGANLTTFKTTLVNLNDQEQFTEYRGNLGAPGLNGTLVILVEEGQEIGQIRAGAFAGYNNEGKSMVINQETGEPTTERNLDRDGIIVGNGLPDFTFGINNTLRFGNLDLSFFFRGAVGHSLVNIQRAYFEHPALTGRFNFVKTKYFNPNDTEQDAYSSNQVEKADFLRLDNATLGYNFKLSGNSFIQSLRAYITGTNLLTITGYSGSDPEVRYSDNGPIEGNNQSVIFGGDILVPGIDRRATYFPTSTLLLGLNFKL